MAYTRVWDITTPGNGLPANAIGTYVEQTKVDLQDRLTDLLGIVDFTTDPLKSQYVRVGYGAAGFGGHVRYTSDDGTLRWRAGVDVSATGKNFVVFDIVNAAARLTIDNATGVISGIGTGLTALTGANVVGAVPNATSAVSATTAGTVTTPAQPAITSVGTLTALGVTGAFTAGTIASAGNISSAGNIRLPNNISMSARNAANTADLAIVYVDVSNNVVVGPTNPVVIVGAITCNGINSAAIVCTSVSSSGAITGSVGSFGAIPALTGAVRIPNNVAIASRNAANSGDVSLIYLDASNVINLGSGSTVVAPAGLVFDHGTCTNAFNCAAFTSTSINCTSISASGNIAVPHANSISAGSFFII